MITLIWTLCFATPEWCPVFQDATPNRIWSERRMEQRIEHEWWKLENNTFIEWGVK